MKLGIIVLLLVAIGAVMYMLSSGEPTQQEEEVVNLPDGTSIDRDELPFETEDGLFEGEADPAVQEAVEEIPEDSVMEQDETEEAENTSQTETTTQEDESVSHVFDVEGVNFAFDVEEIRVKEGDTVTINFVSVDGYHDWVVDEFGAATNRVNEGEGETSVTFVADAAGTYEYYCSVGSHRQQGMVGTLIVE